MEDAVEPRPYRRAGIAIRLVLYPMALGLIALAWHEYHGGGDEAPPRDSKLWSAVTSQGNTIRARTSGEVLMILDTEIVERCTDGSSFVFRWMPGPNRFTQHGEDVRAFSAYDERTSTGEPVRYENRALVHTGDQSRGTIRARALFARSDVSCRSGDVTFTLRRSP